MDETQKQTVIDYQTAFDTVYGRHVLANLREWSGFDDRIIPTGRPDITAFELGKRDMFLHILDKLNAHPDDEQQTESEVGNAAN